MYHSTQNHATTLPRATSATLVNKHQYQQQQNIQYHQHYRHGYSVERHSTNISIANDNNNKVNHRTIRPTYGAYTNNNLPRGPYLQYKFNDQQTACMVKHQQPNKQDIDNNQKNREIQQLKKEFTGLSIKTAISKQLIPTPITYQHKIRTSSTVSPTENSRKNDYPNIDNDDYRAQTLGRYQYRLNRKTNRYGDTPTVPSSTNRSQHPNGNTDSTIHLNEQSNKKKLINDEKSTNNNRINSYSTDDRSGLPEDNNNRLDYSIKDVRYGKEWSTNQPNKLSFHTNKKEINDDCFVPDTIQSTPSIPPPLDPHSNRNDFIRQILKRNINMVASYNSKFVSNNVLSAIGNNGAVSDGSCISSSCSSSNISSYKQISEFGGTTSQMGYVTLADVISVKRHCGGLSQIEGWALLCQSVQALQDLFLADTPSTTRILPLVKPLSLQITCRGRVVFTIIPTNCTGQVIDNARSDKIANIGAQQQQRTNGSIDSDMITFLSPEYLDSATFKCIATDTDIHLTDKKLSSFSESDVEKMWIYSLGITLHKTMSEAAPSSPLPLSSEPKVNLSNGHITPTVNKGSDNRHFENELNKWSAGSGDQLNRINCKQPSVVQHRHLIENDRNANKNAYNYYSDSKTNEIEFENGSGTTVITNSWNGSDCLGVEKSITTNGYHAKSLTSLEYVIASMCETDTRKRASLMYLLDIISKYCRCYHQIKPFSHVVMDLFNVVVNTYANDDRGQSEYLNKQTTNPQRLDSNLDSRSEANLGHNSIYNESGLIRNPIDFYGSCNSNMNDSGTNILMDNVRNNKNELIVKRCTDTTVKNILKSRTAHQQEYETIGLISGDLPPPKTGSKNERLRVRRKDEILKKRRQFRRNTIDVNRLDLERAKDCVDKFTDRLDSNLSKSMNGIDNFNNRIDQPVCTKGTSMPDLKEVKFATLPMLKTKSRRIISTEDLSNICNSSSFDVSVFKSKGPEFIYKSSLPPQEINITDIKCQHRRIVSVLLLNGQSIQITCNSVTTTAYQIFETVIKSENIIENFFLGICALIGGDFIFLPSDLKIYKVAPQIWFNVAKKPNYGDNIMFTLFIRIKFFLPTLRGISSLESRHFLYLQLRKSILESHILCTDDDLISLGGMALQSECGDFQEKMKFTDYFTISHYLPEGVYQRNREMAKYLRNSHYSKRGQHPKEAEQNFIRYVQEMKEYGLHLYSAIWTTDDGKNYDVYISISLNGIGLFQRTSRVSNGKQFESGHTSKISYQRKLYAHFDWLEIENLCFSKHILCVVVRQTESLKAKDNNRVKYKFKMDGRKSYFAFALASEHHKFYMKLRNSFISLKSLSDELNIPLNILPMNYELDCLSIIPDNYKMADRNEEKLSEDNDFMDRLHQQNQPESFDGVVDDKKIEKQPKTAAMRVRNLKKSMLNDNKLLKLKNKFLKRSKSTLGTTNDDKKVSQPDVVITTLEENQNKENEKPTGYNSKSIPLKPFIPEPLCKMVVTPNRTRVKMGTRVFSAQFLNKSFDNIFDNPLDICRIETDFDLTESINETVVKSSDYTDKCNGICTVDGRPAFSDDAFSLKSTSMNSLYFSEKISEKCTELTPQAYVLQSSIKSTYGTNLYSIQNETVSDSLMDKFNDMPSNNNTINDRIIIRVTIRKDNCFNNNPNSILNHNKNSLPLTSHTNNINASSINMAQIKLQPQSIRNGIITFDKSNCIGSDTKSYSGKLGKNPPNLQPSLYLSRSQESIFMKSGLSLIDNYDLTSVCQTHNDDMGRLVNQDYSCGGMAAGNYNKTVDCSMNDNTMRQQEIGDGLTLGISIVQGSDNNVYVKDLVQGGPGERSGIRIGDQILAVDGLSLLGLSYKKALTILQTTGHTVELMVSQVYINNRMMENDTPPTRALSPSSYSSINNNSTFKTNTIPIHPNSIAIHSASNRKLMENIKNNDVKVYSKLPKPDADNNEWKIVENFTKMNTHRGIHLSNNEHLGELRMGDSKQSYSQNDYRKNIRFEHTDEEALFDRCEEKSILMRENDKRNDIKARYSSDRVGFNKHFEISRTKSVPDLPKVVATIPKQHNGIGPKIALPRSVSLSRRYVGPVKYPVTPVRATIGMERQRLSLLADDDDEHVYI